MKKKIKRKQMTNTFDTKIISHNYILYWGELSYIGIFPVDLGMPLIITDFHYCT